MFYASLMVLTVKKVPAIQETQALSLGWDRTFYLFYPLEKEMAAHSSILDGELHAKSNKWNLNVISLVRQNHKFSKTYFIYIIYIDV